MDLDISELSSRLKNVSINADSEETEDPGKVINVHKSKKEKKSGLSRIKPWGQRVERDGDFRSQATKLTARSSSLSSSTNTENGPFSVGSLWSSAFEQLEEDAKGSLRKVNVDHGPLPSSLQDVIDQVIDRTKQSYKIYQERGWKIKYSNGKQINVRHEAKQPSRSSLLPSLSRP